MKKIKLYSLLLCLCLPLQVSALDFLQVLKLAESSDPEYLAAQYNFSALEETRTQNLSVLRPQIELDIYTRQNKQKTENASNPAFNGSDNYNTEGYTLSLTQAIYNHDLYLLLEQTDQHIATGQAELDAAHQSLIIRVANSYYGALAAQDNIKFAQAEQKAIGRQLEQSQQRFNVGLIAITDVKEAQASYDISVAKAISADNQLAVSHEDLRSIIGQSVNDLNSLINDIPLIMPEPADIKQWEDISIKNNLALRAANYALNAAQKEIEIHRAQHYPSLNLALSHNYASPDGGSLDADSTDTSITLNLNIPIYQGGQTSSKTRQAIAKMQTQAALKNKALRNAIKQSRDSYLGITTSIAQVKAFRQALVSTQAALQATQAGLEVGSRTAVDVLAAVRELYRAEKDYAQTRYDYILNLLKLKFAAGTLSDTDVTHINQWLVH